MESQPTLTIEAGKLERQYFSDLWRFRELFLFLSWRDILVRYKQTVIGILWAVLRPFLTMAVFVFIFGKLGRFPSEGGAPYPIMVFAGMLPWQFFATSFSESSSSLLANSNMISKIYFPRIILPFSSIVTSFVDLLFSFAVLIILMVWYGYAPSVRIVTLPLFIALAFLAALGPGVLIAALNVKYRDFRYVIPFIVQIGLYVTPVGFSSRIIPHNYQLLYSLNPMVGIINGFRWAIIGGKTAIYLPGFFLSLILVAALLAVGIRYFRKTEKYFADLI
jgi:lipopolysaccharide transport system permease protein